MSVMCPQCQQEFADEAGLDLHRADSCCSKPIASLQEKKPISFPHILVVLFVSLLGLNTLVLGWFGWTVNRQFSYALDLVAPTEGVLTLVVSSTCLECKPLDDVVAQIENANIIISEKRTVTQGTSDAEAIIQQFALTRLPSVIFESEEPLSPALREAWKGSAKISEDSLSVVWDGPLLPALDLTEQKVLGIVKATLIVPECDECADLSRNIQDFKKGIFIGEEKTLSANDPEAKQLIASLDIQLLPTIVLSKELADYPGLTEGWAKVGKQVGDSFILTQVPPPYLNLETGRIEGLEESR